MIFNYNVFIKDNAIMFLYIKKTSYIDKLQNEMGKIEDSIIDKKFDLMNKELLDLKGETLT